MSKRGMALFARFLCCACLFGLVPSCLREVAFQLSEIDCITLSISLATSLLSDGIDPVGAVCLSNTSTSSVQLGSAPLVGDSPGPSNLCSDEG